jgi:hypothetical protein
MFATLEEMFTAVDESGCKYIRQCNSKGFGSDGVFFLLVHRLYCMVATLLTCSNCSNEINTRY